MSSQKPFSSDLKAWSQEEGPKTLGKLVETFSQNGFMVMTLILMAVPALPLPTGGVTHVFELVVMLLALEMIAGRHVVWLPKRWQNKSVQGLTKSRGFKKLIGLIAWVERYSRPRWAGLFETTYFPRTVGLTILVLTVAAFVAPPFSGLDTLPALGTVIIAFSVISRDFVLFVVGQVIGLVGVGLIIALGSAIYNLF